MMKIAILPMDTWAEAVKKKAQMHDPEQADVYGLEPAGESSELDEVKAKLDIACAALAAAQEMLDKGVDESDESSMMGEE
jgi:hypothetical protein